MSNQDERAATAPHHQTGHSDAAASNRQDKADFSSILKLIGTQIEDSDRRQSQVLTEMTDRVNELEAETMSAGEQLPSDFTPALARVQDGLAQLAEQISGRQDRDVQPHSDSSTRSFGSDTASDAMAQHVEIAPLASASQQSSHAVADSATGGAGNVDEPWNAGDAEQLMQVFEAEHSDSNQDGGATEHFHGGNAAAPVSLAIQDVTVNEAQSGGLNVEREWLEQRFAEIAVRVEQSIREIRNDDLIIALRERFNEFQENVGNALNGVATRADVEALRTAEGEISELREHFEQVQKQFSRLDAIESQLEAVFDRLSDDRLVALLAGHGNSVEDRTELAVAVGEYVSTRVAKDDTGAEKTNAKIEKLHRVVVTLMDEQRKGDEHNAGALDTLQAAMVEVIDRVEAIDVPAIGAGVPAPEQHFQSQPPQPQSAPQGGMPAYAPAEQEQFEPEYVPAPEIPESSVGDGSGYSPSLSVDSMTSGGHEASSQLGPENFEPELSIPDNNPAIEAATAAANRHPDFEPFTENVAGSASIAQPSPEVASSLDAAVQVYAESVDQPVDASQVSPTPSIEPGLSEPPMDAGGTDRVSQQQVPQNTIDRIRQEFVAEAQRAKSAADAQAAAEALEGPTPQKSRSKFGIGLGNSALLKRVTGGEESNPGSSAPRSNDGLIFGLPRRQFIVGAIALVIAAAGVLLLTKKRPTSAPAQPVAIERVIPSDMSTSKPAPESGEAVQLKPFTSGTSSDEQPRQYGDEAEGASDDELPSDALGDRSEIHDGQIHEYNRVLAPGRPAVTKLDGIAMQIPKRTSTDRDIARLAQQRSMAHWSLKLGEAAGNATMATLLPEYQNSAYVPVNASTSQDHGNSLSQSVNNTPVTETGTERRALDLPPATVGPLTLRLAAAKGDPSAEFEVGARLAAGKGTAQNFKKAAHWYKRSASRGFAQSQYRLGTLYERGLGVKKDQARAQIWYRRAAEQGSTKAMHNLAVLSAGKSAKGPDYTTAFHWFAKAAAFGLADSQFNLAVLYENGLGVKKDMKAAYQFYDLAAGAGDKDAISRRDALKAKLSVEQLTAAKNLRATWRAKRTIKIANDAFVAGQAWKSRASSSYSR